MTQEKNHRLSFFPDSEFRANWRRILAFALAVILPILSAEANVHFVSMRQIPFSLYFISVTLVTALGGLNAGLLATLLSILLSLEIFPKFHIHPFNVINVTAYCLLIICAIFVGTISKTRRRSAEELEIALNALQERSDALSQSLDSGKCASWVFDDNTGQLLWYSNSFHVFGREFTRIERLDAVAQLLDPEDRAGLQKMADHMRNSSAPFRFELRTPWPNGESHWLEWRGMRVADSSHPWRGLAVDITERKLAEAALLRSEKLAAMGRLASTVAHEINNPLEAVTNLLYLARVDPTLSGDTRDYLETAEMELARLGNITRLTLGFVRNSETLRPVQVSEIMDQVLVIFRHRFEMKNIQIERHYQSEVRVTITPHELRQIATNLIANAIDAVSSTDPRIVIDVTSDENLAVLSVADNGVGIPSAQLHHIFEPFFTTKPDVGTGIGLWVTKELVEKSRGCIAVESGQLPDGMSSRFRIQFLKSVPANQS
jgi:signal transduction histidine kinase